MTELLEAQQFATVSYIASELDQEISQRIQILNSVASIITPELLASPDKARTFLSTRYGLLSLFNGGMSLVSKDGRGITDYPPIPERTNAPFRHLEYFREVTASGRTAIGKPRIGRFSKKPGVAFSAPIKDTSGRLIGQLVGFAMFCDANFFGQLESAKVGQTGYLVLNDPKYDIIATSNRPSRILQPMARPGVNKMMDRFRAGYEGSGISVNSKGVETLTSAKQIPAAGWIVVLALPTTEAFAPIQKMRLHAYSIAAVLTLFVLVAVWFAIKQLLKPLIVASNKIGEIMAGEYVTLPIKCHDEIGQLLTQFNALAGERQSAHEALRASELRFRNILEHAPIGMAVVSLEGRFVLVNSALCDIVGYVKDELLQLTFKDITYVDDLETEIIKEQRLLDGSASFFQGETRYVRKDGQLVWTHLTDSVQNDGNGLPLYCIKQIENISERKLYQEQIRQLAYYDTLTKLPNRRLLKDRLDQAFRQAKRFERSFALMFLDLDCFKQVNDTLGHDYGDELLKVIAERLIDCVRRVDTVCRQGGDEFMIVLGEISHKRDAEIVAEKIIRAINEPIWIQSNELKITTSIGIALYPVNGTDDAETLMKHADIAMYETKNKGKNGYTIYQED